VNQPTAIAVAEARRAIHEHLTSLPAWDADKVRDALTQFEQVHRDQVLTGAADIADAEGEDLDRAGLHEGAEGARSTAARIRAARAPQEQETAR